MIVWGPNGRPPSRLIGAVTLVLLFVASYLAAQSAAPLTLAWDQPGTTADVAQGFTFATSIDGGAPAALSGVLCTTSGPPTALVVTCVAPFPMAPPGAHTLTLTASSGAGTSAPSAPVSFTMPGVPGVPIGVRGR